MAGPVCLPRSRPQRIRSEGRERRVHSVQRLTGVRSP
jgi:hypothetical protein